MKYLCVGRTAYDITLLLDEYPIENKKIKLKQKAITCPGGCASNVSSLLARWGEETYIASRIGDDYYGKLIENEYIKDNVNTKYLQTNYQTTISYILTNTNSGTRTVLTSPNFELENLIKIDENFDYILSDGNEFPTIYNYLLNHKKSISILDAGKFNSNIVKLCSMVDYIICSNDFAKEFSKIDFSCDDIETLKVVYDKIQENFKGILIITLEKNGSFVKIDKNYYLVPSISVKSIDSTGAGDIYHGAFLYFISHGYKLLDAMKYANITGAISVTRVGGRNSIPTLEEVLSYDK